MSENNNNYRRFSSFWHKHPVKTLAFIFFFGSLLIFIHLKNLHVQLIEETTIQNSRHYAKMLNQFRTLYTSEVVNTISKMGIEVTHDYHLKDNAIPLPATLSMLFGERMGIEGSDVSTQLYSAYPFPWRTEKGGLNDGFKRDAWYYLNQNPSKPFVRFEHVNGNLSVRYAIADVMRPECVSCHNNHAQSPKRGWRVGDVRGVLEVSEPLMSGITNANRVFIHMVVLITILVLMGLTGFTLFIRRLTSNNVQLNALNYQLAEEVAERKEAEVQLIWAKENADFAKEQAELAKGEAVAANKAKSIFLANISHEIRTPMNAILGYTQILQRDESMNDDQLNSLSIISRSGDHLLGLIDDVLDLSKIEAGATPIVEAEFDLVELCGTLSDMFRLKAQQKNIVWEMTTDFSAAQMIVIGDEGKIRQILINLVANAIKFTHEGFVNFYVQCKANDVFHFEISDSGIGIDKDNQETIFDVFNQGSISSDLGGAGLGLAIVKKYLALMSSKLRLRSAVNKGSTFSFDLELPVVLSNRERQTNLTIRTLKPGQCKHLLVVDDIDANRDILARMLTDVGFEVTVAANGLQALACIESTKIDLVFTDLMMPEMDGESLLVRTQVIQPDLPIVAISASSMQIEQAYYLDKGFASYISKPFRFDDIYHLLELLLAVEFEYQKSVSSNVNAIETSELINLVELTTAQKDAIISQCDLYRINEIELLIKEYAKLYNNSKEYFAHLHQFIERYDVDGLKSFLLGDRNEI